MKHQEQIILDRLEKYGSVENVWAINHYILRLSAIILKLKNKGHKIRGYYKRDKKGNITKRYVYELI